MKNQNSIVCIKKNKTDKEGYLFFRSKGRTNRTKKSLGGLRVDPKLFKRYWNETDMRFKSGMPNYKLLNKQIEEALEELEKTNGQIIPREKDKKSFLTFFQLYTQNIKNHGSRKVYERVKIKLDKYLATKNLSELYFNQITPELIKEFYDYLKTAKDPKSCCSGTATHYVKIIKMVIDRKLEDEPRLYIIHPFTGVRYDKKKETDRPVLPDIDIDKLLNSELRNKKIDLNRDKFLFQIFADGMRVSDLLLLRWNNIITGLPISKSTMIPVLPTGKELNPVLKYRMYKTDALVETPITYNLCIILMKLIGHEWRTKEVLEYSLYNDLFLPPMFKGTAPTFQQIEDKVNEACITQPKKTDKVIIEYKGYYFKKEKEEELKDAIDWIFEEKEKKVARLIEDAMYCITRHIIVTGCENNFVFPHLKSQFFVSIKTRPDLGFKNLLDKTQHQKLLNGETLYNRQLKQVAEETGVITNMISHAARHSFAQLLLNEGAPTHEIMNRLRHTNLATTDKYLRHKNFKNSGDDYTSKIGNKQKYRKA